MLRNRSFTPILLEFTYKRQILLVLFDCLLIAFAYYLSYRLRFDGAAFVHSFEIFLRTLPVVIACKMLMFFWIGVYRGIWGYISTNDVSLYIKSSLAGTLVALGAVTLIYRNGDLSVIFVTDFLITTGLLLGVRGSFRFFIEFKKRKEISGDRVVIYGAGRAGELLIREILNNKQLGVSPIGFIDDDLFKKGRKIQGFPILGTFEDFRENLQRYRIKGLLLSFNHLDGVSASAFSKAKLLCTESGLFLKCFRIELMDVVMESGDPDRALLSRSLDGPVLETVDHFEDKN
jgi:UDP-GlcNAc:undecaprenyl-phosphate/decaprenyl-phosphate GlcNAc-1-phosphate transferase